MTTAEPPTTESAGTAYNLAARVYGGDVDGEAAPTPENGSRNGAYNLARRVYDGEREGHRNGYGERDGGADGAPYNLAERIYGRSVRLDGAAPAALRNGAATAVAIPPVRGAPPVTALSTEETPPSSASGRMFQSMKIPAFRWYFIAQFGTWGAMNMQMVVNGYLVFTLTGSFAALGLSALFRSLPGIVLSLVGGVLADRMPKKYLVQAGQAASGIVALGVALLLFFDLLRFEHLLISSLLQGASMSLMMPARQSMLPGLVGIERIQNAQALGMGVMNLMRMIGPAVGGVMLAVTDAHYVYFLMSGLYLYATVMYVKVPHVEAMMRAPDGSIRPAAGRDRKPPIRDLIDGVRYVVRERTIGMLLAVNLAMVLVSMPYQMMLPGYVLEILKGGPGMLGALQSIAGIGSLAAIIVIAAMPTHHRGKVLILGTFIMGIALVGFSFSTTVLLTAPIMVVISIGQTLRQSLSSVLLQTYVDDAFRGRVMSLFMMEMSMVSLATFVAGILASIFGPQLAIGGMAVILLLLTTWIGLFVPRLRNLD
jgi:MFS family permease